MMNLNNFSTRGITLSFVYFLFIALASCSKSEDTPEPPGPDPVSIDTELIKGEWITQSASGQFNRVSIEDNGAFNIYELNSMWDAGSLNERGVWTASGDELSGAYTYKNGANDNSPQYKTVKMKLTEQKRYSFIDQKGTQYKKLLGEIKLRRGEVVVPECMPDMHQTVEKKVVTPFQTKLVNVTSDVVTNIVSLNNGVVTVDSKNGAITGVDYGMTFVDVVTTEGTASIKVIVDDDFLSLIGKTRAEVKQVYGTSNIMMEDFSQIMYNMEGDFMYLKIEFINGRVYDVVPFFRPDVNIDEEKYLSYYRHKFTYLNDSYGDNDRVTFVNASTFDDATLLVRLIRKFSLANGLTATVIYFGTPTKLANPSELYFYDLSVGLDMTKEEIKGLYSENTSLATTSVLQYTLFGAYGTYFKKIGFTIDENSKCYGVTGSLQENLTETEIKDILSRKYVYVGKLNDSYIYYTSDRQNYINYNPDKKTFTVVYRDLWTDYTAYFGKGDWEIYNEFESSDSYEYLDSYQFGNGFLQDVYKRNGNYFIDRVAFVYIEGDKICEVLLQLKENIKKEDILKFLRRKYPKEENNEKVYYFYDETKKVRVAYSVDESVVVYDDMEYFGTTRSSISNNSFRFPTNINFSTSKAKKL